jgi:TP901 family phage tail tape measure protein
MATVRSLYVVLEARTQQFNNQIRAAQREAQEFGRMIRPSTKALNDLGGAAKTAGVALTVGLSAPITAVGTASIKAAKDFESSFAGVRKTVDATEAEFKQLEAGFRNMAREIPVSVNELNKIGESAGQLGIAKEHILPFTRTMADLAKTTNLSSEEAAAATAKIQNIFGTSGKDVDKFGSALAALGNAGASTEKEIVDMAQRIAGTGNLVGLAQDQVLSIASTLSSVGINSEAGGTSISRVFLKMQDAIIAGGEPLKEFGRIAGMSSQQFKQAFENNAANALVAFIDGLGRMKNAGEDVNGAIEGTLGKSVLIKDTLLRASGAGKLMSSNLALGAKAWKENTALTEEANKRYGTLESRLIVFNNTINDIGITLGNVLNRVLGELLRILNPVLGVIAEAVEWFGRLPSPIQTIGVVVAALAAAIGPLLLAFGFIATTIAGAIPVFVAAGGAIAGLGAPVLALIGAIALWVTAIVGAGTALVLFISQNETLRAAVLEAWEKIRTSGMEIWVQVVDLFKTASAALKAIWAEWGPSITAAFSGMVTVAGEMLKNIAAAVSTGLKVISGLIQAFHGLVTGDTTKMSAGLQKIWTALWSAIKGVVTAGINAVKGVITSFTTGVSNAFKMMFDAVAGNSYVPDMIDVIREEFGTLGNVMVDPAKRSTNGVLSSFSNMYNTILGFTRDWKGALKGMFEDFLGGLDLGAILKGDLGSVLGSAKDVLGIGGGAAKTAGGLFGGFGGGSGVVGGAAGSASLLTGIGSLSGIADTVIGLVDRIGAGRKSANEIVKAQNAFVNETLAGILSDAALSATNKLKMVGNEWEAFQSNLTRFAGNDPTNQKTANQSFATVSPLVSQIQRDLMKAGASADGESGGGETYNFTFNVYGIDSPEDFIDWLKRNAGGITEEIKRQMELKEGAVISH